MTDTELITAARAGDSGAWEELYARWLPWVWRYAYALLGDRHTAEDVTSEAMVAWVRRLHESEAEAPQLASWLRTVVRNKSADHIRRLTRLRRAVAGVAAIAPNADGAPPSQPIECDENRRAVRETLAALPERHQIVLEWKYSEGLSVRQIAERLGATEKSVEAALYRARKEFRQRHEMIPIPRQAASVEGGCRGVGARGKQASENKASDSTTTDSTTTDRTTTDRTTTDRTTAEMTTAEPKAVDQERVAERGGRQDAEGPGVSGGRRPNGSAPTPQTPVPLALTSGEPQPSDGRPHLGDSDERSDVSS